MLRSAASFLTSSCQPSAFLASRLGLVSSSSAVNRTLASKTSTSTNTAEQADPQQPASNEDLIDPVKILLQAIDNVRPLLEVRTQKVAARVVYIPVMVHPKKQRSMAVRWLIKAAQARQRSSKAPMAECLALEVLLAYQRKGSARQKRDEVHQLALQNRANMQTKWW